MANIINSKNESKSQLLQDRGRKDKAVANIINSKNESKSQQTAENNIDRLVVANIINSKNESKSQLAPVSEPVINGCGKYHKFKERKQITTPSDHIQIFPKLWQIS
ncbi:MAG: hypothetical protein IPM42_20655 [Saprospiraceae bacterium]|nr:hypothetical protein [Saprospiraceae bacterium]